MGVTFLPTLPKVDGYMYLTERQKEILNFMIEKFVGRCSVNGSQGKEGNYDIYCRMYRESGQTSLVTKYHSLDNKFYFYIYPRIENIKNRFLKRYILSGSNKCCSIPTLEYEEFKKQATNNKPFDIEDVVGFFEFIESVGEKPEWNEPTELLKKKTLSGSDTVTKVDKVNHHGTRWNIETGIEVHDKQGDFYFILKYDNIVFKKIVYNNYSAKQARNWFMRQFIWMKNALAAYGEERLKSKDDETTEQIETNEQAEETLQEQGKSVKYNIYHPLIMSKLSVAIDDGLIVVYENDKPIKHINGKGSSSVFSDLHNFMGFLSVLLENSSLQRYIPNKDFDTKNAVCPIIQLNKGDKCGVYYESGNLPEYKLSKPDLGSQDYALRSNRTLERKINFILTKLSHDIPNQLGMVLSGHFGELLMIEAYDYLAMKGYKAIECNLHLPYGMRRKLDNGYGMKRKLDNDISRSFESSIDGFVDWTLYVKQYKGSRPIVMKSFFLSSEEPGMGIMEAVKLYVNEDVILE